MSFPDPDRPKHAPYTEPAWLPALSALAMMAVVGAMSTWLVLQYDAARPGLGEIIVFLPSVPDTDPWRLPVSAEAVLGRVPVAGGCVFDPTVMAADGGSLIIEAREEFSPPRFRLHWAGGHTARGKDDCGTEADIVLNRLDLQRLANAAGGFGARPFTLSRRAQVSP